MYIEDEAGTDLTVTVEDQEYEAEATVDVDSDGVDETAVVHHADGSALAFSDTDGDGQADLMTAVDEYGEVTGEAGYDPATGDWIGLEPTAGGDGGRPDTMTGSDEQITVDTPDGEIPAGPATYDTDGDGVNDSVVIAGDGGDTTVFTDVDGDGDADVATEITGDGQVTVAEHAGDGEWTVIERGRVGDDGSYQRTDAQAEDGWGDVGAWSGSDSSVSVDPVTGQWVRG